MRFRHKPTKDIATVILKAVVALTLTAGGALLIASPGTAAGARESIAPKVAHVGEGHALVSPSADTLLYDQNNMDSNISVVSQNFEHSQDANDAQGADDFTVPAGQYWTVKEVDATGNYAIGNGPADSENVFFYRNAAGRPGALVHRFSRIVGADSGDGSFAIDLGGGVNLAAGHYWVSVQANMHFNPGENEWFWETRTAHNRRQAMWRNPGDGLRTGCTTYRLLTNCLGGIDGPDFMFALRGNKN